MVLHLPPRRCGELGWMDAPTTSPDTDEAAPSNYPGARLFHPSTSQTKSNPDIRNSKLAHIQAGF